MTLVQNFKRLMTGDSVAHEQVAANTIAANHDLASVSVPYGYDMMPQFRNALSGGVKDEAKIDHEAVNSAAGDFYTHQASQLNND